MQEASRRRPANEAGGQALEAIALQFKAVDVKGSFEHYFKKCNSTAKKYKKVSIVSNLLVWML